MSEVNNKVDRLEHDKALMFSNHHSRRMFLALIAVCVTFSLVIIAYTVREKFWIDALVKVSSSNAPAVTEVVNGTQQSGNP